MYTEAAARVHWCPFVRFSGAATATDQAWATNRGGGHGENAFYCLASDCMAWRWDLTPEQSASRNKGATTEQSEAKGHCGLAGSVRQ